MSFPRTLLLTRWAPDAHYAGGEVLRKLTGCLPRENLAWAHLSTSGLMDCNINAVQIKGEPLNDLHWRLETTALNYFIKQFVHVRRVARKIALWALGFRPDILWVASDMFGIDVGLEISKIMHLPVHLTVYDEFKCCRLFDLPPLLNYPVYMNRVRRIMNRVGSLDAVSSELVEYLCANYSTPNLQSKLVMPPSVENKFISKQPDVSYRSAGDGVVKIGVCGSSRVNDNQWKTFVNNLSHSVRSAVIVAFADEQYFNKISYPDNVSVTFRSYLPKESDVIKAFTDECIHACYLGLWREARYSLFVGTSLSSKLISYVASGVPVIVDGPVDSAAWKLIGKYGAGVLLKGDALPDRAALDRLFMEDEYWQKLAEGATELCREEFSLEINARKFMDLMSELYGPKNIRQC